MIYVIGWLTVKPGKREELMVLTTPVLALTRKEKGCLFYELHPSTLDSNLIVVIEGWETKNDHEAHQRAPHHLAFGSDVARLSIEGKFEEIEAQNVVTQRPRF